MGAIWRNEWIIPFETPWSIFEKFSCANIVDRNVLLRTLGNSDVKKIKGQTIGDTRRELFDLKGFDLSALNSVLSYDLKDHNEKYISLLLKPLEHFDEEKKYWFRNKVHWCEDCIRCGYHSWWNQFILLDYCMIHNKKLHKACIKCGKEIPFLISNEVLKGPFQCKCSEYINPNLSWNKWSVDLDQDSYYEHNTWINNIHPQKRLIFLPKYSTLQYLISGSLGSEATDVRSQKKFNIDKRILRSTKEINEALYVNSRTMFKSIDQYIRKILLKKHKFCIHKFENLLKTEGGEFEPICPCAYAYVFWKKSLFQNNNFRMQFGYEDRRNGDYLKLQVPVFSKEIIHIYKKLSNIVSAGGANYSMIVPEIINKITCIIYLNYFKEWIKISVKGSEKCVFPNYDDITRMHENSVPQFVIESHFKTNDIVTRYKNKENISTLLMSIESQCNPKRKKNVRYRSFVLQNMAMMIYSDPANLKLREEANYVERYVRRLM